MESENKHILIGKFFSMTISKNHENTTKSIEIKSERHQKKFDFT